jgi:putative glutamine amidotransferase
VTVPRRQSTAFRDYLRRIEEAGGAPREITPGDRPSEVIESIDGLLLPGGADVDPARYDAIAHSETEGIRPELDNLELEMLGHVRERSLPVLAICRGHQLLNVALGGALHQHIDGDAHRAVSSEAPPWEWPSRWHSVTIDPQSRLAQLMGASEIEVNSRHHQAVLPALLAPGLRAVALSPDGFVEASEPPDGPWMLSVQWHPEREEVIDRFRPLFFALLAAASERMAANSPSTTAPALR